MTDHTTEVCASIAPCLWNGIGLCPLCGLEHGRVIPGRPIMEPVRCFNAEGKLIGFKYRSPSND